MITPQMIDEHVLLVEILLPGGHRIIRREMCIIITLSTTYPAWIFLAENPNLLYQNPATNSLGHERALLFT